MPDAGVAVNAADQPGSVLVPSAAGHRLSGVVAAKLAALAERCASGALKVGGDPGGVIYLRTGYLVFAESVAAPDLRSRLVNSRRLLVDQWRQADQDSRPDGCAGDLLLRRGLLDAVEWETLLRSATLDALVVLALQLVAEAPEADVSFTSQREICAGSALRLEVGAAWAYAWQEAGRLAAQRVVPGTRLRPCGPRQARPSVGPAAGVVLDQISGLPTVRDLAWRNGLALYAVMNWVTRLIQDGVCTVEGPVVGGRPGPDGLGVWWTPPDPDVLGRVLDGLRRLA